MFTGRIYGDADKLRQWDAFLRRLPDADTPKTLAEVVHRIEEFLAPVVDAIRNQKSVPASWSAGIGWSAAG